MAYSPSSASSLMPVMQLRNDATTSPVPKNVVHVKTQSHSFWTGYQYKCSQQEEGYWKRHELLMVRAFQTWGIFRLFIDTVLPLTYSWRGLAGSFFLAFAPNVAITVTTLLMVSCTSRFCGYGSPPPLLKENSDLVPSHKTKAVTHIPRQQQEPTQKWLCCPLLRVSMMEPGCWLSAMAAGATLSAPSSTELGQECMRAG